MTTYLTPKVSVIIPVYNTELYIEETLQSIRNQTLNEIEIIVINDGSTDNSLAIILSIAQLDSRITVISQINQGQSVARNTGIFSSKGDYLYFMDSDDIIEHDTLKCCYEKCLENNLDFVFFDADILNPENDFKISLSYLRSHLFNESLVKPGLYYISTLVSKTLFSPAPWLNIISKKYLDKIRLSFYPGIIHEDQLFTFILYIKAERVSSINKTYFKRRLRENSTMTNKFNWKNVQGYLAVTDQLIAFKNTYHDHKITQITDKFIFQMLNGTSYGISSMSFRERLSIVALFIIKYSCYISFKSIIRIIFSKLIHK